MKLCPPGFYCMDFTTILLGLVIGLGLLAIGVFFAKQNGMLHTGGAVKPTVVVVRTEQPAAPAAPVIVNNTDPRFNPLSPEQSFSTPPDLRGFPAAPLPAGMGAVPINVMTRGYPDTFQQIGVLTAPGGTSMSATPTRTILPLFGRKLVTNRDRWNYYTRTDGMNPVQVPIQFKRRNCDDDNGCEEITDGDSVGVPIMGQSYVANVYRYSTPRYLPVV